MQVPNHCNFSPSPSNLERQSVSVNNIQEQQKEQTLCLSIKERGQSALNSLHRKVSHLTQKTSDCCSCIDSDCLRKAAIITFIALALLGIEVYFMSGAYYCDNEPDKWGSFCTTSRDKHGHISYHSAKRGAIGYGLAATLFPFVLIGAALKTSNRR